MLASTTLEIGLVTGRPLAMRSAIHLSISARSYLKSPEIHKFRQMQVAIERERNRNYSLEGCVALVAMEGLRAVAAKAQPPCGAGRPNAGRTCVRQQC